MNRKEIERTIEKHQSELLKHFNCLYNKYSLALTTLELIAASEIVNVEKMQEYVKRTLKSLGEGE